MGASSGSDPTSAQAAHLVRMSSAATRTASRSGQAVWTGSISSRMDRAVSVTVRNTTSELRPHSRASAPQSSGPTWSRLSLSPIRIAMIGLAVLKWRRNPAALFRS